MEMVVTTSVKVKQHQHVVMERFKTSLDILKPVTMETSSTEMDVQTSVLLNSVEMEPSKTLADISNDVMMEIRSTETDVIISVK